MLLSYIKLTLHEISPCYLGTEFYRINSKIALRKESINFDKEKDLYEGETYT
jgi:hypothetical protein